MESALYGLYASFYLFIYLFLSEISLVRFLVGQQLVRKRKPVLSLKYSIYIVLIFGHLILPGGFTY